ncbi:MAG: hypothetical protein J6Y54_02975 [Lentisphaeria bacterium]|nr:hypothetical protein [Lentisphaeria bacterium]
MTTTEATAYNCVRRGVARTRAELARVMGVSRPTASTVTDTLISSGLLRDGGKCRSSGGRAPTLLVPRPDAFSLIGVDINASGRLFGVRVDALGDVTDRAAGYAVSESLERTTSEILALWERLDPDFDAIGIGIAVGRGTLNGAMLMKALRRKLIGKYIHVAERLSAAAVSEGFRGGADPERDYLLLSLEETLETVICIGGRPFPGAHGAAGDLGRLPVPDRNGEDTSFDALAAQCTAVLRCVLAVLDPGAVVLAGRFTLPDAELPRHLKERLGGFDCRIVTAKFGEFSAARGAALQTHFSI